MPDRTDDNFGGAFRRDDARSGQTELGIVGRTPTVLPERIIRAVIRAEIERLIAEPDEVTRFFEHIFAGTAAEGEVAQFETAFLREPPDVVIGYPRQVGVAPIISLVLSSDAEAGDMAPLGQYLGTNAGLGEGTEVIYRGGFFSQTSTLYVYAHHPDMCVVLYHLIKLILLGARIPLEGAGLSEMSLDGGDVSPQEMPYLPDSMFVRQLTATYRTTVSVPERLTYRDGSALRIGGLFRSDVVLEGRRGSVKTYEVDPDGTNENT